MVVFGTIIYVGCWQVIPLFARKPGRNKFTGVTFRTEPGYGVRTKLRDA